MKWKPALWMFLGVLVCMLACQTACVIGPTGGYRVPEPNGRGKISGGFAAAVQGQFIDDQDSIMTTEAQAFVDMGIGESTDMRLRLTGVGAGRVSALAIGPGIEFKFSSTSSNAALVTGLDFTFFVDLSENSDDEGSRYMNLPSLAALIGGVFAWGEPGHTRFVFSSVLVVYPSLTQIMEARLSLGLDLPFSSSVSLRPELTGSCKLVLFDELGSYCSVGLGTALVF